MLRESKPRGGFIITCVSSIASGIPIKPSDMLRIYLILNEFIMAILILY
jgi:hypothetical protein